MAGHLLSTVNPEASDAIRPVDPAMLPRVAQVVQFIPRPGEAPGGRTEFPLIVTGRTPDGKVVGVAVFDGQDFRDIVGVYQRSDANPIHCWDWPAEQPVAKGRDEPAARRIDAHELALKNAATDHAELAERVSALEAQLTQFKEELGLEDPKPRKRK